MPYEVISDQLIGNCWFCNHPAFNTADLDQKALCFSERRHTLKVYAFKYYQISDSIALKSL